MIIVFLSKHQQFHDYANELYEYIVNKCKNEGFNVQTGIFGAKMDVTLLNDGPVTIIFDSNDLVK